MEEFLQMHFTSIVWAIIVPTALMLLDVITGYYNAWKNNEVSSTKMRDGLGKKCAELAYIVVGFLFKYAFGTSSIMYFIVLYICYMELVSLAENCDKLGVKLPANWGEKLNNNIKEDLTMDTLEEEIKEQSDMEKEEIEIVEEEE